MLAELDIAPRGSGRASKALSVQVLRDLAPADLALLASERGIKPPPIKELRERHHALARCLASGLAPAEASAITGYSLSRISILKGDDTFKELVAFYQEKKDAAFASFQERAAQVSITALDIISDRLEDAPEDVTLSQALEITKTLADRTGHAPINRIQQTNVNVNLGGRLAAARARLETLAVTAVVDVPPDPDPPPE